MSLSGFERLSEKYWGAYLEGQDAHPILYLPKRKKAVLKSGAYLAYRDFDDVFNDRQRERIFVSDEPLVAAYHSLVIYFTRLHHPEFADDVTADIRYQPYNHSRWNEHASTHNYFLEVGMLRPYTLADPKFKIAGIGTKGRQMIGACIDDE